MPENQNIEYKQNWRDEYLKWICGFANADGGIIYIGKDDKGNLVELKNSKKLLEDIPNKVRDILGIIVDVNLHRTDEGEFIEIITESYPNAISYKGQYHYRSGSTKQELKGNALEKFLLQKKGKHWDGAPIPNISPEDLKQETLEFFKDRGISSKRLNKESRKDNPLQLLDNLKLIEGEYLKRAAILLFHPDPERFVTGAYIKIGYFENKADLVFQDEIHGNIFEQIEQTIDILFTKYIKAIISYKGIQRIETYEYPLKAIREALLNAIAHKDYSSGATIQIRVYKNKLMIWNPGQLPDKWTIDTLLGNHSSKPFNPDIANALFRSGYIESWGRGVSKMISLCLEANLPIPKFEYYGSDICIIFEKDIYNEKELKELGLNDRQIKAVLFTKESGRITNSIYQEINKCSRNTASNDLADLVGKNIFISSGQRGAGAFYSLK